jgi:hypothetical protein
LPASELRSLTWGCLDLQADPPTVTVRAAYSKHRREDTLPLQASTAQMLARWGDESGTPDAEHPVFGKMARKDSMAKMFRADLGDARAAWIAKAGTPTERKGREESDHLEYRDLAGRVADFHCLRHSFISNLARGGVHPKLAQQLARHSTITLTMDRYSHTVLGELSDALSALPELTTTGRERESEKATGTYDSGPNSLPLSLPTRGARREPSGSSLCNDGAILTESACGATADESKTCCASTHCDSSPNGEGGIRTLDTGVHPYDGLANRWFQPLTHLSRAGRRPSSASAK